jgi:DNA-directed RNA polymerase subunit E'/Rpb7
MIDAPPKIKKRRIEPSQSDVPIDKYIKEEIQQSSSENFVMDIKVIICVHTIRYCLIKIISQSKSLGYLANSP